jgi:hypothetical protein
MHCIVASLPLALERDADRQFELQHVVNAVLRGLEWYSDEKVIDNA